ncbi:type VI-B CRISPR-associated RNA-guided ribonuclease Cas13b [Flavobacterium covae]|uniref:type VI-B CRISPR-associated RNA-guided ribonuclease Cas13b n=1 Tax=Flavobacterium covae TaxID=2906076 RepID=UPI000745ECEC|nr:type VI-B CRISPR-associated RNA-guided ribonuclease Cas13b [Flavobacterium covae]AMA48551.1 hypothetical protein AWN65_03295 [Flavobacterium covae]MCJ1807877.1 type VI-B CRISPR-associated RNA-guided ribonuclease Cas13b [Flavobacterium covae]
MSSKNESYNKQKTFNHYKQEDKYFFGGFLNNADDNLRQVGKEFKTRINFNHNNNELASVFKDYFNKEKSVAKREHALNLLSNYFPVLERIQKHTNHNFEQTREIFELLLDTIKKLRDYYTHHYHKPITINPKVYDFLDDTLLDVLITIKKKKVKNDTSRELLKEKFRPELTQLKNQKREELIKKGKKLLEENLENAVFNHCLRPFLEENKTDDKQNKTVSLRKYRKSKPNEETSITLTQSGLVFLISFFLHRKEFQVFTSGLEGFKAKVNTIKEEEISLNKNNIVYMITHWSYSYYNFKGLKHRIKTDQGVSTLEQNNTTHSLTNTNTKEALLTQIVDYLSKVPNEIYETLSEKQQKEFEEDINEYMRENPENEDSTFSSIVSHKVIRKRYENKFNYFAMRFLDEYAELPTLRFMVNFGDYIKDRQKKILESIQFDSERIIKKEIHLFEKLGLVTEYKKNVYLKETSNIDLSRFPLFPSPSYVMANNNIPFYIDSRSNNLDEYLNQKKKAQSQNRKRNLTFEKYNKEQSKDAIIAMLQKEIGVKDLQQRSTIGLLSCNELPSMLYEVIVKDIKGAELENKIAQKIREQYQSIRDFTLDSPQKDNIPTTLTKTISTDTSVTFENQPIDIPRLKNALQKELTLTQEKLLNVKQHEIEVDNYNRNKNTYKFKNQPKDKVDDNKLQRKYVFYRNEIGQEANWLASDLIHFMKNKSLWKGYMHNELQSFLAFFEDKKNDCIALLETVFNLKEDCILTKDLKNLFLKHGNFIDFYKEYLKLKEDFLNTESTFLENGFIGLPPKILKKELSKRLNYIFIVFQKRQFIIKELEEKKNNLYADAINLSRGIFDEKPTMIPFKKPNPDEFASWFVASYQYNNYQSFYELTPDKIENDKKKKYKNLRAINKVKIQDYYLKLMVDTLYQDLFNQPLDKSLSDFYVSKTDREKIKADAKAYQKRNDSFLWNKVIHLSLQNNRITANPKLKDIGKYKRALQDEKIATLLTYDDRTWTYALQKPEKENENDYKELHYTALNMELQEYEKVRSKKLLKQVQELEKQILDKFYDFSNNATHPEDLEIEDKKGKRHPNFKLYITKALLKNESEIINLENIDIEILIKYYDYNTEKLKEKIKNMDEDEKAKIVNTKENYNKITNVLIKKALVLIIIRNKMAHNQYPPKFIYDLATRFVPKKEEEYFACYFNRVFETITTELWENKKKAKEIV